MIHRHAECIYTLDDGRPSNGQEKTLAARTHAAGDLRRRVGAVGRRRRCGLPAKLWARRDRPHAAGANNNPFFQLDEALLEAIEAANFQIFLGAGQSLHGDRARPLQRD